MIKNKKGDIPITILVIGVVALCAMAIATFYIYDQSVKKDFMTIEAVEDAAILKEKISLYEKLGFEDAEIKQFVDLGADAKGNYIYVNQKEISVKYYIP